MLTKGQWVHRIAFFHRTLLNKVTLYCYRYQWLEGHFLKTEVQESRFPYSYLIVQQSMSDLSTCPNQFSPHICAEFLVGLLSSPNRFLNTKDDFPARSVMPQTATHFHVTSLLTSLSTLSFQGLLP